MLPPLSIGVQLRSLKLPFRKALQVASQLGADAVEIDARAELKPSELSDTGIRQLKKMLADLNLKVAAVRFQTRRGYHVQDQLDARIQATKDALAMAYKLAAPVVVNQVGQVPADPESREFGLLVEVLTDLGHFGNRTGAWLAASTGTESGEDLKRLLGALPEHSVVVNFDPGSLLINGFSPREDLQALGPWVRHVYGRDGVKDLARGRGLEVPLGRGSVDFPELLAALEHFNYSGYLTVVRENPEDPVTEVGQAVKYLRSLWD